jgi:hypothetical protein
MAARLPATQAHALPALTTAINELDTLAKSCRAICFGQTDRDVGHFARALATADGIRALRRAMTAQIMEAIMDLQGTSLGFKTDRDDKGGYEVAIVRDCLIEATLRGAAPINNEWNIISSRPYLCLNYFKRILKEYPGLSDLELFPGVPYLVGTSGALVDYRATWRLDGKPMRLDRIKVKLADGQEIDQRIPVRVNSGQGADAILGKAERKMRAAILAKITGTDFSEGEVEDSSQLGLPSANIPSIPPAGHGSLRGNGKTEPPVPVPPADVPPANVPPPDVPPPDAPSTAAEMALQDLQDLIDGFTDEIKAAERSVAVDRIRERIKAAPLTQEQLNSLLERCDIRNKEFQPAPRRRDF